MGNGCIFPGTFFAVTPIRFYLRFSNIKCQKFLTFNIWEITKNNGQGGG